MLHVGGPVREPFLVSLKNFDFCPHQFPKGPHSRSHELELNVEKLVAGHRRNVNLNLEKEHNVLGDSLGDFKEIFLQPVLEVIDEEAPCVPVVVRPVKDLKLDVGSLTCLHLCVELVLGAR